MAEQKGRTKIGDTKKAGGAARGSSAADVLRAAKALIRKGWCQGNYAQTNDGTLADLHGTRAVRFCAEGAVFRAAPFPRAAGAMRFLLAVIPAQPLELPKWNDHPKRTKKQVLAVFDRAIELASNASAPKEPPEPSTPDPEAQRG